MPRHKPQRGHDYSVYSLPAPVTRLHFEIEIEFHFQNQFYCNFFRPCACVTKITLNSLRQKNVADGTESFPSGAKARSSGKFDRRHKFPVGEKVGGTGDPFPDTFRGRGSLVS
jgi:hypothetical protein